MHGHVGGVSLVGCLVDIDVLWVFREKERGKRRDGVALGIMNQATVHLCLP
jgi:hypothetical protein